MLEALTLLVLGAQLAVILLRYRVYHRQASIMDL